MENNLKQQIKHLENIAITLCGNSQLQEARIHLNHAINILLKYSKEKEVK